MGYFSPLNNYLRDSTDSVSSERLLFYLDAPRLVTELSVMVATLAHEFQHMIHYYQKGTLHNVNSERWLDEMADAVEAALRTLGNSVSFGDLIVNWAVANLLSDDTGAPAPYRYNSGTWSTSSVGAATYRVGSINLFNYRYGSLSGPRFSSLAGVESPYAAAALEHLRCPGPQHGNDRSAHYRGRGEPDHRGHKEMTRLRNRRSRPTTRAR